MELKDTIPFMISDNFNDRLKAEYLQVSIRCDKLRNEISRVFRGEIVIEPKALILLREQLKVMQDYKLILKARLELNGTEF